MRLGIPCPVVYPGFRQSHLADAKRPAIIGPGKIGMGSRLREILPGPRSHFNFRLLGPSTGSGRTEKTTITVRGELVEPFFKVASCHINAYNSRPYFMLPSRTDPGPSRGKGYVRTCCRSGVCPNTQGNFSRTAFQPGNAGCHANSRRRAGTWTRYRSTSGAIEPGIGVHWAEVVGKGGFT